MRPGACASGSALASRIRHISLLLRFGLADIKSAFQLSQDRAYGEFAHAREQIIAESRDLAARMAVTQWLFDRQLRAELTRIRKT